MELGIRGRIALVCASTSGLGRASAETLAAEGADVALVGRRMQRLDEVVDGINRGSGGRAIGIAADLLSAEGRREIVGNVRRELGEPDILVLNGPGPRPATALDVTPDEVEVALGALVVPHVALVEAFLPHMREQKWGRIVAVGSSSVDVGIPTLALSTMGRSALAGWLKLLSCQVAADGVTVNLVLPGRIATDRIAQLDAATAQAAAISVGQVRADTVAAIPASRLGTPAEFGAIVAFLASLPAAYITGTAVRIDGGATPIL